MKILFCIDSLRKGGAERVISNLANAFVKEDLEINILKLYNGKDEYELNEKVGIFYLEEKIENNSNYIKKLFTFLKRRKLFKKKIKQINPDIIVAFLPYTSFLVLSVNLLKIPIVISVRNDPTTEYANGLYKFLMKKLYPKANGFVFQTEDAQRYFKDILNIESVIIPNSINPNFIVDREFVGERKKEIVSVARLFEQKNHELLINAFIEISNQIPDYKLIIYGEGYMRDKLQLIIDEHSMNKRIYMPGNIQNVKEKIYDASLFVLSSDYEGMPNALMEAMCLGVPSISTDCPCGGPRFFIDNYENGILVKVGDKEMLQKEMLNVLNDKDLSQKISHNSIKISKILEPNLINSKWKNYILKVLNESRK